MKLDRDRVLDRVDILQVDEESELPVTLNWERASAIDIAAYMWILINTLLVREQDVYTLMDEREFGNPLILMLILNENAEGRADKPLWYRDELGYLYAKKFARFG